MRAWAVIYHPTTFSEKLYLDALAVLDPESQAKIKRFYHRADSCRTLIGRLLVRGMLIERGVLPAEMKFSTTTEGKPYIASQTTNPPIAYNITHDNSLIAMAFGPGLDKPPAFSIGIDVMKLRVPWKDTVNSFIEIVGDQLTQAERMLLKAAETDEKRLELFFWMWTLKEAYTKAIGLGLGFDFQRVDFDPVRLVVLVDGTAPHGWRFHMFTVTDGEDRYLGVIAEFVNDSRTTEIIPEGSKDEWLTILDAAPFAENTICKLRSYA